MARAPFRPGLWLAAAAIAAAGACQTPPDRPRGPEEVREDKRLEARIKEMFLRDSDLRNRACKVEVINGFVYLSGIVQGEKEHRQAITLTMQAGVSQRKIVDNLEVRPATP